MSDSSYNDLILELQVEYLASFPQKFATIKELFAKGEWYPLELEFHKLKGTGKTYGVPEVSTVCREMERICKNHPEGAKNTINLCLSLLKEIQISYQEKKTLGFELEADPRYKELQKAGL